jgi:hypothetical protein
MSPVVEHVFPEWRRRTVTWIWATQTGDRRAELRRLALLQKLQAQVQLLVPGPFDKEDIMWVKKTNWSGRGKKEVLHAVILWNRLEDFVEGESTYCDFPCAFLRKKKRAIHAGSLSRIKISSYMQHIR